MTLSKGYLTVKPYLVCIIISQIDYYVHIFKSQFKNIYLLMTVNIV